jgi:hypothetical protein
MRLQEKITFDDLMETLSEEFARLPDHRRATCQKAFPKGFWHFYQEYYHPLLIE